MEVINTPCLDNIFIIANDKIFNNEHKPKNHKLNIKGAFNIKENIIVNPISATKEEARENILICLECSCPLILKKGDYNKHHFCHFAGSDCSYYDDDKNTTPEQEEHKNAKLMIQKIFYTINCDIVCSSLCHFHEKYNCNTKKTHTYNYSPLHEIQLEKTFPYNNKEYVADIAIVDETGEIVYIIEIYNTSRTEDYKRPEPWNELNAISVFNEINDYLNARHKNINSVLPYITFKCIRKFICKECSYKEELELIEKEKQAQIEAEEYAKQVIVLKELQHIKEEEEKNENIKKRILELEKDFNYVENDDEIIPLLLEKHDIIRKNNNMTKKYPAGKKRCATCYNTIDIKWKKCFNCYSDAIGCVIVDDDDKNKFKCLNGRNFNDEDDEVDYDDEYISIITEEKRNKEIRLIQKLKEKHKYTQKILNGEIKYNYFKKQPIHIREQQLIKERNRILKAEQKLKQKYFNI